MAEEQNIRRKYKNHKIEVAVFCIAGVIFISLILIYLDRTINSHTHVPIPDPKNSYSISNINNKEEGQNKLGCIDEPDKDSGAESSEKLDKNRHSFSSAERPALEHVQDVLTTIQGMEELECEKMDIPVDIISNKAIEPETIIAQVIFYCKRTFWMIQKAIIGY
ncbi:hypothetical protein NEPAR06_2046 [Nematocida parisii]|uniref:Uncharacterized protein n=1 Tax=Nematocida parisii (strain ERTm3) TaxID=935791 RepID=I3EDV5_NEMP3|nr:uncharacterized protein NEPG_00005 [Nematocida parisii ERTm1]EIJ87402.1 hypothetical protein NEQG_02283 [Nematocida parisii ERTm3]KAI5129604.1 hypothetical protein NEPAR08_1680 [Nematocida parisii]EIJ94483.1 hypothetical protein NEPG_00005 [Nematocida parisii ERTm1]KAI5129617.1 hypothetical protein NEPAR03_1747 [Nematocida parisii]KAI5142250.1 hypothetical protein NEPAR04_1496 [Nematocida parisii]|eukprot:XP_013057839.1 hypothetical protein NEPG_00005 [Nematocida parisii ERTm1]